MGLYRHLYHSDICSSGPPLTVDFLDLVLIFLKQGYKSAEEPLKVQFLSNGMKRGDPIGNFQCCWEVGMTKALAVLVIIEAIVTLENVDLTASISNVLPTMQYMACTWESAESFEVLVARRLGAIINAMQSSMSMCIHMIMWPRREAPKLDPAAAKPVAIEYIILTCL